MFTLYFLRHGQADWPDWEGSDDERPLTKKGKKEMKRVAEFLYKQDIIPAAILSSPLVRAYETAAIVAKELDLEVTEEPALVPGFDASKLPALLAGVEGDAAMIVGHEPSFSDAVRDLTGADVKLPKAGLVGVELESRSAGHGRLIFLIPPKLV